MEDVKVLPVLPRSIHDSAHIVSEPDSYVFRMCYRRSSSCPTLATRRRLGSQRSPQLSWGLPGSPGARPTPSLQDQGRERGFDNIPRSRFAAYCGTNTHAGMHCDMQLWQQAIAQVICEEEGDRWKMLSEHSWEAIAAAKREELLSSIPSEWIIPQEIFPPESQADVTNFPEKSEWFTADELEITSSTASEILQKTATGVWSAEAVTRAFCKRAAAAHQLVC
ncbi:hypothetical protein ACO22_05227 [Paracoccidioides brasiliensis]|uniref:Uncharacterized protein n=1 Tax=Paracoccidioides brasiliensis TaxID=121759 RepID=A0A1D2JAW9_PARBR|nr:hypothetical protein ACO22_05227 [Paracoccidioides brasiliensis]